MIAVPGVFQQHGAESVIRVRTADDFKDILIAVVVEVRKGDGVAFLQMTEAAGSSDILELLSVGIAKSEVGHDGREIRIAGAREKIEPAIVVQIAEIERHREDESIQSNFL